MNRTFRAAFVATTAATVLCSGAVAAQADRVVIGASGSVSDISAAINKPVPTHKYYDLGDGMNAETDAKYLNIEADGRGQWRAIARGEYDTAIFRWAYALDDTGVRKFVSFNHEPSVDFPDTGTARDYRRAYRAFAQIMHEAAPKVRMVWAVTQLSLYKPDRDPEAPNQFWPGKVAVDYVSSNSFNRFECAHKAGPWTTFGYKVKPLLALAREHDEPVLISEFGMGEHTDRARWLNATTKFIRKHERIGAAFYYNSPWNDTCEWELQTDAEFAAFSRMMEVLGG